MLRPDYLSVKEAGREESGKVLSSEDILPDLYRRYVMEHCSTPPKSANIESFQNCNLLRYHPQGNEG